MKEHARYIIALPDYALPYLINGDESGLELHDLFVIDNYMLPFYGKASEVHGDIIICPSDDEPYFTWHPSFGLACNIIDTIVLILIPE